VRVEEAKVVVINQQNLLQIIELAGYDSDEAQSLLDQQMEKFTVSLGKRIISAIPDERIESYHDLLNKEGTTLEEIGSFIKEIDSDQGALAKLLDEEIDRFYEGLFQEILPRCSEEQRSRILETLTKLKETS
jgi:hypothetical protein